MGSIQRRQGPNVVGFCGLFQPLADGFKLVVKEIIVPRKSNIKLFTLSPFLTFTLSLLAWAVIPFGFGNCFADLNFGVLYLLATSGLGVYGIILAGWASNSKYAFLGALRGAAQMISYEVSMSLTLLPIIIFSGSLNLTDIVYVQIVSGFNFFFFLPLAVIFFISALAETNRAPFDLAEAEAEIVAGYNLEYSSIIFAMFFLGEYGNMLMMSAVWTIFFLGGWHIAVPFILPISSEYIFAIKVIIFGSLFILVRAILPRFRYDQLMYLG
jgi:NADH-quinone oxidoreductase subunit H